MTLTDVQVRLLHIVERRNELQAKADALKDVALDVHGDPASYASYLCLQGHIAGLQAALDGFNGLEPIKSLEYLASRPEARESRFELSAWKV